MRPRPAPARFPYYEHRTIERADADEMRIARTIRREGIRNSEARVMRDVTP